ncbi:MAG: hypothetical protein GF313_00545 [Caldithrix sp.]|nr:hypothetical protein [Caldithrix sp.]
MEGSPMKIIGWTLIITWSLLLVHCRTTTDDRQRYSGAYLGQIPPDSQAVLFAPDFITTGMNTRDITFTPDGKEVYFSVTIGNHTYATIMYSKEIQGQWIKPRVAPFAADLRYMSIEPHITPDGKRLFFASDRPELNEGSGPLNTDIWFVDRRGQDWSPPRKVGQPVNTEQPEFFPTTTENGTLYFTRDDPETGISYIYRSKYINGRFQDPELLPKQINAGQSRYNAFVAPDESFVIIPIYGRPDSFGATDYYISFHNEDDAWTDPIHLPESINSKSRHEYSASISPDGKSFFFMSSEGDKKTYSAKKNMTMGDMFDLHLKAGNGNSDIYWISASFIQSLRP